MYYLLRGDVLQQAVQTTVTLTLFCLSMDVIVTHTCCILFEGKDDNWPNNIKRFIIRLTPFLSESVHKLYNDRQFEVLQNCFSRCDCNCNSYMVHIN